MIINELVTKFSFRMGKGLAKYNADMLKAKKTGDKATKGVAQSFSNLRKALSKQMTLKVSAKNARGQIKMIHGMVGKLRSTLGSMPMIGGLIGGAAIGGLAKFIFDTNVEFEKLYGSLNTAAGGAKQADAAFSMIEKFASETPFALEQSIQAFVKLKNLGLDPSEEAMRSYGNTASAMSKDMSQMIEAVADASTGEFERLKEFGIKASKQGDQVTFTFRGVKKTIKNDSKEIQKYLMDIGNNDFGSAMSDQMKSLPGAVSNVKDSFKKLQREIGKGGLSSALVPVLKDIGKWLNDLAPKAREFGRQLALWSKDAARFVKGGGLAKALGAVKKAAELAAFSAGIMLAAYTGSTIIVAVNNVMKLAKAIRAAGLMQIILNGAIAFIPTVIGAVALAVIGFLIDFAKYLETGNSWLLKWLEKWPAVENAVKNVYDSIVALNAGLNDLGGVWQFWKTQIINYGNQIKASWVAVLQIIKNQFSNMRNRAIQALLGIQSFFNNVGNNLKNIASNAVDGIVNAFAALPGRIAGFLDDLKNKFMNAFAGLKLPSLPSLPSLPGFNIGGMVPGGFGTRDTVPAMLTPGELVVPVPVVKQLMTNPAQAMQNVHALMGSKANGMTSAPAPGYQMSSAQIVGNSGGIVINAPITQQISVTGMAARDPVSAGKNIGAHAQAGISRGLSNAARQVPRRVAAPA